MRRISRKRRRSKFSSVLVVFILFIGIGFATLSSVLGLNGNFSFRQTSWDVHFANPIEELTNTVSATTPLTIVDNTNISFGTYLPTLEDSYTFYVDVVNAGNVDAMLSSLQIEGYTEEVQKYVDIKVNYRGGAPIRINDLLKANTTQKIEVIIKQVDAFYDDSDGSDASSDLSLSLEYVIAKDAIAKEPTIIVKGDGTNVGDEVAIAGEPFVVLYYSEEENTYELMAKYNLYVGFQGDTASEDVQLLDTNNPFYGLQSKITETNLDNPDIRYGTVPFSKNSYWNVASPSDRIYNKDLYGAAPNYQDNGVMLEASNPNYSLSYYVEGYRLRLEQMGVTGIIKSEIPKFSDVTNSYLHIDSDVVEENLLDMERKPFFYGSSYWFDSAIDNMFVGVFRYDPNNTKLVSYDYYWASAYYGVRPVIYTTVDILK